jgi:hypothetical protein
MEDFDLMYMMKTPFFMGNLEQAVDEAPNCEVSEDDQASMTLKNLLLVRALSAQGKIDQLKSMIQGLMQGDSSCAASV